LENIWVDGLTYYKKGLDSPLRDYSVALIDSARHDIFSYPDYPTSDKINRAHFSKSNLSLFGRISGSYKSVSTE